MRTSNFEPAGWIPAWGSKAPTTSVAYTMRIADGFDNTAKFAARPLLLTRQARIAKSLVDGTLRHLAGTGKASLGSSAAIRSGLIALAINTRM